MDPLRRDREKLRTLLRNESLQFGDFTLASGRKSRFYFDSKRTTLLPDGARLTAAEVLHLIRKRGLSATAIGGPTLGADPIVCSVAALSEVAGRPMRAFIVRKQAKAHGTAGRIEGNLEPGCPVIVVEDVVTTGGSILKAIDAVIAAGHPIEAVVCLVDREEGGTEALSRWPFHPIFRRLEIFGEGP